MCVCVCDTHTHTHQTHATNTRTWVNAEKHAAFHPKLPPKLTLPDLAELLVDDNRTPKIALSQRALVSVASGLAWLELQERSTAFDAANKAHATAVDREAARLVSHSQAGAGAWLRHLPDGSVKGSVVSSAVFISAAQRRLGLYISVLRPGLDAAAHDRIVTQHERLGDRAINASNHTRRHNAGLHAVFNAYASVRTTDGADGRLKLGDRGDGTPASKAEAKRRYAHINDGHVPDIIRFGASGPHTCIEFKCCTPHLMDPALGNGSRACGGAASQADGGRFAFGNTAEHLTVTTLGTKARGHRSEGPLDRRTGLGWVAATTNHDYADAQRKGNYVLLLITESSGAMHRDLVRVLHGLALQSSLTTTEDSTQYGTARTSPSSFLAHHLASISAAVVYADAQELCTAGKATSHGLTIGLAP